MLAQKKVNMEGIEVGIEAPDIMLPSIDGDTLKLSELENRIILVNFWASWCSPCRKKNTVLIKVFQEFKDAEFNDGEDGFDIFSVSLDRNAISWTNSIKKDSVNDFINVGDMLGWESPAAKAYCIKSIPSNVLVNGSGVIIAVNITPSDLKKKLKRMKKGGWLWF